MKIFLDTANREYIKKLLPTGVIDGVTTNPSLLSKEGSQTKEVLRDICAMVPGPVSIEVVEKQPDAVLKQAREIAQFAKNIVVKIPFALEYMPVIKTLAHEGVPLNITLVFTPLQALMVAKLGVSYISPFLGRWDDIGVDSIDLLEQTVDMKESYDFASEILAASVRSIIQWQHVVQTGADIITVPPTLFEHVFKHPLTERGIALFDADWQKLGKTALLD